MSQGFVTRAGSSTTVRRSITAAARLRGRLEFSNRRGMLRFVARFENGSTELTKLKNQSTGTAVISLAYDANNSLEITWQKVSFATAELGETDGIVTVSVECLPMWDATNGIVSAVERRKGRRAEAWDAGVYALAAVFALQSHGVHTPAEAGKIEAVKQAGAIQLPAYPVYRSRFVSD